METFWAFIKEYGLLSGAGLIVFSAIGWLVKSAFSKQSPHQTQTLNGGGNAFQAGRDIRRVKTEKNE
ncbi:hypothetical protein D9M68_325460 [compost metagenome]